MNSARFLARRTLKAVALASTLALGGVGLVGTAQAADGTGTANATVVRPITIDASNPHLRFGSFTTNAAGQTVTIAPGGGRTLGGTAGAVGLATGQNPYGPASFLVSGEGAMTYAITLPTSAFNITTGAGGVGQTMAVSAFQSNPTGTNGLLGGTAGTAGTQTLLVGATITTVASQATGIYSGSFTVTVAYN